MNEKFINMFSEIFINHMVFVKNTRVKYTLKIYSSSNTFILDETKCKNKKKSFFLIKFYWNFMKQILVKFS